MPAISASPVPVTPVPRDAVEMETNSVRRARAVKTTGESLLEAVKNIEPIIREHAQESEERSRLAKPVVEAMREARLFAMWIPKSLGGLELDPMSAFRVVEEVSRIDSAAGWNLQLSLAAEPFGAWLPDEGAEEIYSKGLIMAGTLFPPAQAVPVDGGYRVTGRTPFVSGCHHCSWFIAPAHIMERTGPRAENGEPVTLLAFLPASDGEIIDNWETLGMRGTGSHDVAITDKFVPEHHTGLFGPFRNPGTAFKGPLYRFSIWHSIAALAAPAFGIARAAIDELATLAKTKTPAYATKPVRERVAVQSQIARAEAALGSAKAYMYEGLRETWETCLEGKVISMKQKMKLQSACSHAVLAAAAAVDLVHACAGTTGIRNGYAFQKHFRDIHVITQHAFGSASRFEDVGKWMLDLEPEWPFFHI